MDDFDLSQYLALFLEESRENLDTLNGELLRLEREPENREVVANLFRAAHTLKGMAATMGFEAIAALTHELEDVLDLVRVGRRTVDPALVDVLFRAVDTLGAMLDAVAREGRDDVPHADVLHLLRRLREGGEPPAASPLSPEGGSSEPTYPEVSPTSFPPYVQVVVREALRKGYGVYRLDVELVPDALLKAARAFLVYRTAEEYGEVLYTDPPVEDIEEERMGTGFSLLVATSASPEELRRSVANVSEVASVTLSRVAAAERDAEPAAEGDPPAREGGSPSRAGGTGPIPPEGGDTPRGSSPERKAREASAEGRDKLAQRRILRVDAERLDKLMNLFSELVIDRGRLELLARESGHVELQEVVEHMYRVMGELQMLILGIRMVPLEQVFHRFPRMVRDLARELGKEVEFVTRGEETELDRTVIDEIGDPLVHLLRNAVDHGIETPEERRAAGKPPVGRIELVAYPSGSHVYIEVQDDGRGISRERVLRKAVERGLVRPEEAEALDDEAAHQFLFYPGFTTKDDVSDVSGRGVGLDAVKNKIESLGGSVSVFSREGRGTLFRIQLPLTLSILTTMLVGVEGETYAIPVGAIVESLRVRPEEVRTVGGQPVVLVRDRLVPLVDLAAHFGLRSSESPHTPKEDGERLVVVIRRGERFAGLVVDRFYGQQEVVLKPLGSYLAHIPTFSGATILGDGQIALILEPAAFFAH
ncbi:MAG: chemotaxis protein CheA [Brockia lithotrophica]|nr:chemotaxis protein CheA [Brockia lithotrophica]